MNNDSDLASAWPIVGHAKVVNFLQQTIAQGTVSHAYLFYGPGNVGKSAVASSFAQSLTNSVTGPASKLVEYSNLQTIVREVNPKTGKLNKNIKVEQIRKLQDHLSLKSFVDNYKVAIIDEAQSLNSSAANSLLKTLEEPSEKTVMILITDSLESLPKTIISRCQSLPFNLVNSEEIYKELLSKGATKSEATLLSRICNGRPGVALKYLKNPEMLEDYLNNYKLLWELASVPTYQRLVILKNNFYATEQQEILDALTIWLFALRDVVFYKLGSDFPISNSRARVSVETASEKYTLAELKKFIDNLLQAKKDIRQNINQSLVLENFALAL